jgi:hypothetical protein
MLINMCSPYILAFVKQIMIRAAKNLYHTRKSLGIGSAEPYRDDFIPWDDIKNVKKTLDKETWSRHNDDGLSTILWMKVNPKEVILYQEPASDPFVPFSFII